MTSRQAPPTPKPISRTMSTLVRPYSEWDEVDELFYKTGAAFWFIATDEFQLQVVIDVIYWRIVHEFGKPDFSEVGRYRKEHGLDPE